jgi:hypothetical protein
MTSEGITVVAMTVDCDPDAVGCFPSAITDYIHRLTMKYAVNDVSWVEASRYAYAEALGEEWYADLTWLTDDN